MNPFKFISPEIQPGTEAFQALNAEDEPWLPLCFLAPTGFEQASGSRSVIVYGEPGFGKTALYNILLNQCATEDGHPSRLVVNWSPAPMPKTFSGDISWVSQQADALIDACALKLAAHLAQFSQDYHQSPHWVQNRLGWFIHRGLKGDLATRLGPLMDRCSPPGRALLEQIIHAKPQDVLYDALPDKMAGELLAGFKHLGMDSIWVMSDGMEGWAEVEPERLSQSLKAFLSTLALFEKQGLVFKFFLPVSLSNAIRHASSVNRRRVELLPIRWETRQLRQLVEKRLALVFGREPFQLENLCSAEGLESWLDRVGGASPREWLDQLEPLVSYALDSQDGLPVSEKKWKELCGKKPPRFWMDESGRQVRVGGREVPLEEVPPKAYNMLKYLYQHSGEVVGKDQLFYFVYQGMNHIPNPGEKGYEFPKDYEGVIDTSIYRLRQAIEPDPKNPILLLSVRGHGVKLVSRE